MYVGTRLPNQMSHGLNPCRLTLLMRDGRHIRFASQAHLHWTRPSTLRIGARLDNAPVVLIVVEVPRGSFLKRGSSGRVDFISPFPCPFNYGCVPSHIGLEGDLLDALILGPRLPLGTHIRLRAWGAVTLTDRGMSDDKLVCAEHAVTPQERCDVLRFFRFYAKCKGLLNALRGRPGRNECDGWCDARTALSRARPRDASWNGPPIEF